MRPRLCSTPPQSRRPLGDVGEHPADGLRVPALSALWANALGVQRRGDLAEGQLVLLAELAGAGPAGLLHLLRGQFLLVGLPAVRRGAVRVPPFSPLMRRPRRSLAPVMPRSNCAKTPIIWRMAVRIGSSGSSGRISPWSAMKARPPCFQVCARAASCTTSSRASRSRFGATIPWTL